MESPPKSIWQREMLPDFFIFRWAHTFRCWAFSRRGLRSMLILLVWVVTLIALFYGEEDWRGRRAWNDFRRALESRGEKLDLQAFIPKPIPDDQNFAATPFIKSWFRKSAAGQEPGNWNDAYDPASLMVKSPETTGANGRGDRRFMDLVAWGQAFDAVRAGETNSHHEFQSSVLDFESRAGAVRSVLSGMLSSEANLRQLRTASSRPYSIYPVVYNLEDPWGILLPHLARVKAGCLRVQLKACAELAGGESDKALEDVLFGLYLADTLKEEPFLISYLVRISCLQIAAQSIWEGLAERKWSESQLARLQNRLLQFDLLLDIKRPMDSERAAGVLTCDLLNNGKYKFSMLTSGLGQPEPPELSDLVAAIIPRGWYDLEKLNYCRLHEKLVAGGFDSVSKQVWPARVDSGRRKIERGSSEAESGLYERGLAESAGSRNALKAVAVHHEVVAAALLPALWNVSARAAEGQTIANQAALACALERFRLATGRFPDQLESLVPKFISQVPHDVISGDPYKYRATDDGRFLLYSLGWNEKDDGGVPGKTLFDRNQGDWVWQYAGS